MVQTTKSVKIVEKRCDHEVPAGYGRNRRTRGNNLRLFAHQKLRESMRKIVTVKFYSRDKFLTLRFRHFHLPVAIKPMRFSKFFLLPYSSFLSFPLPQVGKYGGGESASRMFTVFCHAGQLS